MGGSIRSLLLVSSVAALLLPGVRAAGQERPGPSSELPLVWRDVDGIAGFAFETVAEETRSLLGPSGLELTWTRAEPHEALGHEAAVILLGSPARGALANRPVMGAVVRVRVGPGSCQILVFVPAVARALGLDMRGSDLWSLTDRRQVALALGRVIAHEIVHTLLPELPHSSSGLMAPSLSRTQLLESRLHIDGALEAALRKRLEVGDPAPVSPDASVALGLRTRADAALHVVVTFPAGRDERLRGASDREPRTAPRKGHLGWLPRGARRLAWDSRRSEP